MTSRSWLKLVLFLGIAASVGAAIALQITKVPIDVVPIAGCDVPLELPSIQITAEYGGSDSASFVIENSGDRDCSLSESKFIPDDGTMDTLCKAGSTIIPVGGKLTCVVTWSPVEGMATPENGYVLELYWDTVLDETL